MRVMFDGDISDSQDEPMVLVFSDAERQQFIESMSHDINFIVFFPSETPVKDINEYVDKLQSGSMLDMMLKKKHSSLIPFIRRN